MNKKKNYLIILLAILPFVYVIVISNAAPLTLLLGIITILLGLLPGILYFKLANYKNVPLIEVQGLFYAVTFGFMALVDVKRKYILTTSEINITLLFTSIGLLSLYIGYYTISKFVLTNKIKTFAIRYSNLDIKSLKNISWLLLIAFMLYDSLFSSSINSVYAIISTIGWFSYSVLLYLLFIGKLGKVERKIFILIIMYNFFAIILSSHLEGISSLLVLISMILLYTKKRVPISGIAIVILAFLFLQAIKGNYRETIWYSPNADNITFLEKTEILYNSFMNYYNRSSTNLSESTGSSLARLDHFATTAYVISMTPGSIDYLYGATYTNLLTKIIPRILWSDKPVENIGNAWAKPYGLLNINDYETSYNLPWITEYYINFGIYGIVISMMILGLIFKYLVLKFSGVDNPLPFLIGVSLLFSFYLPESNFSLKFGSIIIGIPVIYIYIRFIKGIRSI